MPSPRHIYYRWRRFWRIAPSYLKTVARREWQLAFLAIVGLAPGVAALCFIDSERPAFLWGRALLRC